MSRHHNMMRAASNTGEAPIESVKSVIFDIADNYSLSFLGIRSIEFILDGQLIEITLSDIQVVDSTSDYAPWGLPKYAFLTNPPDAAMFKTGSGLFVTWYAAASVITNQRLLIVFNEPQNFDGITINNAHHNGSFTGYGAKNVKIHTSTDVITDVTYNAVISNSTLIFNSVFKKHVAADVIDDDILTLL